MVSAWQCRRPLVGLVDVDRCEMLANTMPQSSKAKFIATSNRGVQVIVKKFLDYLKAIFLTSDAFDSDCMRLQQHDQLFQAD